MGLVLHGGYGVGGLCLPAALEPPRLENAIGRHDRPVCPPLHPPGICLPFYDPYQRETHAPGYYAFGYVFQYRQRLAAGTLVWTLGALPVQLVGISTVCGGDNIVCGGHGSQLAIGLYPDPSEGSGENGLCDTPYGAVQLCILAKPPG